MKLATHFLLAQLLECVEVYVHSSIHLHDVIFNEAQEQLYQYRYLYLGARIAR
jgi:hypothetical protein